jgi:alpha-beta hydrolase superfamily lysophospholipase
MSASVFSVTAADGTQLSVEGHPGVPDGPVALILHGIASHAGWYRWLGEELAAGGVNAYLTDRRGAGISGGPRGHVRSWRTLVEDVVLLAREIAERHPGSPLHGIGISLGGAVLLAASILHPRVFRSHVLLSPGLVSGVRLGIHRRLRLAGQAIMRPMTLHDLPFSLADLCHRLDWQEEAGKDPLRTQQISARFAFEIFRMQRFVRANSRRLHLPILALLAGKDTIINNFAVVALLSRSSSPCVRIETFEDVPHNLLVSLPREAILERLTPWLRSGGAPEKDGVTLISVPPFPPETHEPQPAPR